MVLERGFAWNGETYGSLPQVAKAQPGTAIGSSACEPQSPTDPQRVRQSPNVPP